jgi:hypothetical protein
LEPKRGHFGGRSRAAFQVYFGINAADVIHADSLALGLAAARRAVEAAPSNHLTHAELAADYGQLGEREAAGRALHELLRMRPNFAALVRAEFAKWWTADHAENFIDGLRKVGLEVPPGNAAPAPVAG